MGGPLTISVPTTVPARLVLVPEYGDQRDATDDDLRSMGYVDRSWLYAVTSEALAAIVGSDRDVDAPQVELTSGEWSDTTANLVRYFIETAICYHDLGGGLPGDRKAAVRRILDHLGEGDVAALRLSLQGPSAQPDNDKQEGV